MKNLMLKIAGVKSEAEFYKKFPTEESFMKAHGKEFKKAQKGANIHYADVANQSIPIVGDIIKGVQLLKDEKEALQSARQMKGVSDIMATAATSKVERPQRRYIRPEDMVNTGEEFFPVYGVGTNVLARNGGEVTNTYAPNNLYTNLEEAQDGAFLQGLSAFGQAGGTDLLGNVVTSFMGENAGGNIGSTIGGPAGRLIGNVIAPGVGGTIGEMVGKVGGQAIGTLVDKKPKKTEQAWKDTMDNVYRMAYGQNANNANSTFSSYMKNGGNTNPQVVKYMNGLTAKDYEDFAEMRTGGNIRQNVMDGDLQVYRGGAEPISYNPYMESGGETVMFRGPSHEDGGMPISYGASGANLNPKANIEVEGGEPATKIGDNLVVFGNLQIPNQFLSAIGDKDAKGKKFKTYAEILSQKEAKQNKLVSKSTDKLSSINVTSPHDKLTVNSLNANILGANMKLKDMAEKKRTLSSLQSAINDTAEEHGLVADDLVKGKITKAQNGATMLPGPTATAINKKGKYVPEFPTGATPVELEERELPTLPSYLKGTNEGGDWGKVAYDVASNLIPLLRPSDAERLSPNQLLGEMYALSTNQLEPVQTQLMYPELSTPYDISYQDILDENTAQARAISRLAGYNPAAQANIAAQVYLANQKVLGEQFRANQEQKAKTYAENRAILNATKAANLERLDQQYVRQEQAKATTKATTQAALNSIAAKFAQNQLENRTLATYENLYNYRFDPRFRAWNINAPYQFDIEGSDTSNIPATIPGPNGTTLYAQYKGKNFLGYYPQGRATTEEPTVKVPKEEKKKRNGTSLARAIHNL